MNAHNGCSIIVLYDHLEAFCQLLARGRGLDSVIDEPVLWDVSAFWALVPATWVDSTSRQYSLSDRASVEDVYPPLFP